MKRLIVTFPQNREYTGLLHVEDENGLAVMN